jgi:UDP-2,4-diacetamido-2,4,6-trideoxy-beta-L-altropyranose hydrolase
MIDKNISISDIILRPVAKSDVELVHKISNQDSVRKASFNSEIIDFNNHKKWFDNILKSRDEILLIALVKSEVIGQLRFSIKDDNCIIGISLLEKYQGKGLGKELLALGIYYMKNNYPNIQEFHAFVKHINIGSQKLFESLNFEKVENLNINNEKAYKYVLLRAQ